MRRASGSVLVVLVLMMGCVMVEPCSAAAIGGRDFNVLDYGAVGDGTTEDTAAIRRAAAALAAAGGGRLLFPAKHVFLTAPFNITSNTVLEVDNNASIVAVANATADWPVVAPLPWYGGGSDYQMSGQPMYQSFIRSFNADNITLTGGGTIDGSGSAWWACWRGNKLSPPCLGISRPHLIMLVHAMDVVIRNITLKNSPNWTLHLANATRVLVERNTIRNPANAPNADGIDLDCVQDALVQDNDIAVGDDALCVKSGIDWLGRHFGRPSRNILLQRNKIGTGHGITIGSEMSAGVQNVTFRDHVLDGTANGIRIKSQRGRGGEISDIVYENLQLSNILDDAIQVTLDYHAGLPPTNATATPQINGLLIRNATIGAAHYAGLFQGLPESPLKNVVLEDVVFTRGSAVSWDKCEDVAASSTCSGRTNVCPPCFPRFAAADNNANVDLSNMSTSAST